MRGQVGGRRVCLHHSVCFSLSLSLYGSLSLSLSLSVRVCVCVVCLSRFVCIAEPCVE
jgi:hypothetical protein